MTFEVKEPVCEVVEPDSQDEEEDEDEEIPLVSCKVSVTCKWVDKPEDA